MQYVDLKIKLDNLVNYAYRQGYKVETPKLFVDNVYGNKLAYYQHGLNKIVMHEHFVENASPDEVEQTLIHELAHAIAEQNNQTGKAVWHGQAWKDINAKLGGNASRYHKGGYSKPAPVKKTMAELFAVQPKRPADDWERGTFKQWLTRGYHVRKGEKGQLSVWTFVADEYETDVDGKTAKGGRAAAVYFTPDQVEPNTPKAEGK
ncbi:MAG TPA: SprT-like domain-containing protein [Verrucomicrobiae bacterium]|nr:SprT-like domain-containing protein [Verrucomicrobiae bacterium]